MNGRNRLSRVCAVLIVFLSGIIIGSYYYYQSQLYNGRTLNYWRSCVKDPDTVDHETAMAVFIELLSNKDPYLRYTAASVLVGVAAENHAAIVALQAALRDEDKWVRASAARSLGTVEGDLALEVVIALVNRLKDKEEAVRVAAAQSLMEKMTVDAAPALQRLAYTPALDGMTLIIIYNLLRSVGIDDRNILRMGSADEEALRTP